MIPETLILPTAPQRARPLKPDLWMVFMLHLPDAPNEARVMPYSQYTREAVKRDNFNGVAENGKLKS